MFIQGNKEEGFRISLILTDMKDSLPPTIVGGIILITLSAEKAKELEARLEEVVNPKEQEGR